MEVAVQLALRSRGPFYLTGERKLRQVQQVLVLYEQGQQLDVAQRRQPRGRVQGMVVAPGCIQGDEDAVDAQLFTGGAHHGWSSSSSELPREYSLRIAANSRSCFSILPLMLSSGNLPAASLSPMGVSSSSSRAWSMCSTG